MPSRGRRARQRGKRGEREVAAALRIAGYTARRSIQSRGAEEPDVVTDLPYWVEVKYCERLNIFEAMKQAENDKAKVDNMRSLPHIVVFRKNNTPWCVCLTLEEFLKCQKQGNSSS